MEPSELLYLLFYSPSVFSLFLAETVLLISSQWLKKVQLSSSVFLLEAAVCWTHSKVTVFFLSVLKLLSSLTPLRLSICRRILLLWWQKTSWVSRKDIKASPSMSWTPSPKSWALNMRSTRWDWLSRCTLEKHHSLLLESSTCLDLMIFTRGLADSTGFWAVSVGHRL